MELQLLAFCIFARRCYVCTTRYLARQKMYSSLSYLAWSMRTYLVWLYCCHWFQMWLMLLLLQVQSTKRADPSELKGIFQKVRQLCPSTELVHYILLLMRAFVTVSWLVRHCELINLTGWWPVRVSDDHYNSWDDEIMLQRFCIDYNWFYQRSIRCHSMSTG